MRPAPRMQFRPGASLPVPDVPRAVDGPETERHRIFTCACGVSVIWGDLATEKVIAAWNAAHVSHRPLYLYGRYVDGQLLADPGVIGLPAGRPVPLAEFPGKVERRRVVIIYRVEWTEVAVSFLAVRELREALKKRGAESVIVERVDTVGGMQTRPAIRVWEEAPEAPVLL